MKFKIICNEGFSRKKIAEGANSLFALAFDTNSDLHKRLSDDDRFSEVVWDTTYLDQGELDFIGNLKSGFIDVYIKFFANGKTFISGTDRFTGEEVVEEEFASSIKDLHIAIYKMDLKAMRY